MIRAVYGIVVTGLACFSILTAQAEPEPVIVPGQVLQDGTTVDNPARIGLTADPRFFPDIDADGNVYVPWLVLGTSQGTENDSAILKGTPTGISIFAQESQSAPEVPAQFGEMTFPARFIPPLTSANSSGAVTFWNGQLSNGSTGLFRLDQSVGKNIFISTEPLPGIPSNWALSSIDRATTAGNEWTAVIVTHDTPDISEVAGVWVHQGGQYSYAVPNLSFATTPWGSGIVTGPSENSFQINSSGDIVFEAFVTGSNRSDGRTLFRGGRGQEVEVIMRIGDPAPNNRGSFRNLDNSLFDPGSCALDSFDLQLADTGEAAFFGAVQTADGCKIGLYLQKPGEDLQEIAFDEQIHDPSDEKIFFRANSELVLTKTGKLAFAANIRGADGDSAIFKHSASGLERLIVEDQSITQAGEELPPTGFINLLFNDEEHLVFKITNPLGNWGTGDILYHHPDRGLHRIVKQGDLIVPDAEPINQTFYNLDKNSDSSSLNERGQLAFLIDNFGFPKTMIIARVDPPRKNPRLVVDVGGNGIGDIVSNDGQINCPDICSTRTVAGSTVALTASAIGTSRFLHWTTPCGTDVQCDLSVNNDINVSAIFANSDTLFISGFE